MFQVVNLGEPSARQWVPVQTSAGAVTLYEGQIVQMGTDGVTALGAASGANNTSSKTTYPGYGIPYGVVIGTSRRNELYDTTYQTQKITSLITSNANLYPAGPEMAGIEGGWGSDQQAYVYVERIFPWTILKGPLYFTSLGTAPTVATVLNQTTGGATGMGFTTAASCGVTGVASQTTIYFRTGANQGLMRVGSDTSTTVKTVTSPFPYAIVAGDTLVTPNIRPAGTTRVQFDSLSLGIIADAAATSDYFSLEAVRLNLIEAGKEYLTFRFGVFNFMPALA